MQVTIHMHVSFNTVFFKQTRNNCLNLMGRGYDFVTCVILCIIIIDNLSV